MDLLSVPPVYRLETNADARNAYGGAAQEIVRAALKLRDIPINGNCEVCFDAEGPAGLFWEIKSVHRGAKIVLYDWRMQKEASAGKPLLYAVLCHRVRKCRDGAGLFAAMSAGGLEVLIIPAERVHELAATEPLRTLKTETKGGARCGYNRAGYAKGYRNLGVSRLRELCKTVREEEFNLYGTEFTVSVLKS